jgi:hypothetical protein|nr:MAG TPA: hypothetical protein [Caudoviricetes sp.]
MTTKQEYIDTLCQMEELYYNSDNCTLAMNLFKEDINLLTGLVNEHFEEKKESNFEHYKDEIIEGGMLDLALVDGKLKRCSLTDCNECEFNPGVGKVCKQRFIEWVKKPYEKPTYKLSQFEFDLIQTYRDGNTDCNFSDRRILRELKDKGYFKCVGYDTKIHDVLEACEVIG